MCSAAAEKGASLSKGRRLAVGLGVLILLTAVFFGRSVTSGLLLDDYNHRAGLQAGDWSLRSLVDASHLGGEQRRVAMWWQKDADLYFFRPVAFLVMRATYVAGGWRPTVMHLASLAWTTAAASLILLLAWRTVGQFGWALLAAVIFLLHPNDIWAPRWIACQNELMATTFMLAALLTYSGWAGWFLVESEPNDAATRRRREGARRAALLAATLFFYIAALGCRESAVILPVLLAAGDWCFRSNRRKRSRIALYAVLALLTVGYLILRRHMLGPLTIPARPYAYPPGTPGFLPFVLDKFVYYILGLWAYVPIVAFAGEEQMHRHPVLAYGTFAAIVATWCIVLSAVGRGQRRQSVESQNVPSLRGPICFWLIVALLPLGPVLPVFASAHHLFLPAAGVAVAGVIVLASVTEWAKSRKGAIGRLVRGLVVTAIACHLLISAGMQVVMGDFEAGASAACQLPVKQVIRFGGQFHPGDSLFFINMPMLGFNAMPAIEEASGVATLHGYALTFAPNFMRVDRPGRVDQVGPNQLRVHLDAPGYFSGLIGKTILQGIDRDRPFAVGETFTTPQFTVRVTQASDQGVQEFLFTFNRPLADPAYHFFLASPVFDAYPLKFAP